MRIGAILITALLSLAVLIVLGSGYNAESGEATSEKIMLNDTLEIATLAGGCFWCVESDMEKVPGVAAAISGYAGGHVDDPSYEQVTTGSTGHREAVQVHFDPAVISYAEILNVFWRHIDPTDQDGSFGDRGFQYSPAIYFHNETQRLVAEESRNNLHNSGIFSKDIETEIVSFTSFYKAEDYHQDYYKTHATRYKTYRHFSGRNQFIEKHWGKDPLKKQIDPDGDKTLGGQAADMHMNKGFDPVKFVKPSDEALRDSLTPLQYRVTQHEGTEQSFENTLWDNKKKGIYVDIVSGEPLFSSKYKYRSGTGWPSFDRPLEPGNIVEKEDRSLFGTRIEIRSKHADSHLGHVFNDGPPSTGLRYCMNSAALRFIPKENMAEEGYEDYLNDL